MKNKFLNKEEWTKIKPWFILGISLIAIYILLNNSPFLLAGSLFLIDILNPLIMAIAIAFILNIPMVMIEKCIKKRTKQGSFINKRSRSISVTLTVFMAIIVILLIVSILIPRIASSLVQLFGNMGGFIEDIFSNLDKVLASLNIDYRLEDISPINNFIEMPWDSIFKNTIQFLGNSANGILSNAMTFTSIFFVWFMAFMLSLYLLNGKEALLRQVREVTVVVVRKEKAQVLFKYMKRANDIFKSFVTGQLTEAVIIGVLYYIGLRGFGFPYPELIAMIVGLFSLVPVFGPMCAMGVGVILVLSSDPIQAVWFVIFFQVLSQIEDNLIYPRIVGNSVGLPGLWVMLSIFILGNLFGIVGMITAVPLTAFVYSIIADNVHGILNKRKIKVDHEGNIEEV